MSEKVIVASTNPVKLKSVQEGFMQMFLGQEFEYIPCNASSGVRDQPMSEQETLDGATNRAKNSQIQFPDGDYFVGIEGGIEEIVNGMEVFAWVVVLSRKGVVGRGKTGSFFLPQAVAELVKTGMELGHADDKVFGRENSKHSNGAIGLLTGDIITRTQLYIPAVIFALIPFKNPSLYFKNS